MWTSASRGSIPETPAGWTSVERAGAGSGRRRRCRSCPRRAPSQSARRWAAVAQRRPHGERLRVRRRPLASVGLLEHEPVRGDLAGDRPPASLGPARPRAPPRRTRGGTRAAARPRARRAGDRAVHRLGLPLGRAGRREPRRTALPLAPRAGSSARRSRRRSRRAAPRARRSSASAVHRAEDRGVGEPVALVGHVELERRHAALEDAGDLRAAAPGRGRAGSGGARSRSPPRRRRRRGAARAPRRSGCPTAGWAKSTTVVVPPNAAARVPVANVSAVWTANGGKVGSFRWTCPSIAPGIT